jgi:hypothetical protein
MGNWACKVAWLMVPLVDRMLLGAEVGPHDVRAIHLQLIWNLKL